MNISISDTICNKEKSSETTTEDLQNDNIETPSGFSLVWDALNDKEELKKAPNPQCTEYVCTQEFWVPERNLCLYCGFRGKL